MEAPSEASADVSDAVSDGAELLSAFPEAAESAEADVSPVCVSSGADDACCDEDVPAVPVLLPQPARADAIAAAAIIAVILVFLFIISSNFLFGFF